MIVFKHNYKVFIPTDYEFNYKECKKLYKKNQKLLQDNREFRELIKTCFFYSFYFENQFLGCIYYYEKDNKMYVNALAKRHTHLHNIECFKESLNWFNCDIYANAIHKTSKLCVLKCGFKRIKENLFIYRR